NLSAPQGATVIDGRGKTVLPGFIDSHTHAFHEGMLRQAAMFGVTTELDMMSAPGIAMQMRSGRDDPTLDTQRSDFFSAGAAVTRPGGHGTQFGIEVPTLDEGDDAQEFVRRRIREGSDYIKIIHEDGAVIGRPLPTLSGNDVRDAAAAARSAGLVSVAHVGNAKSAKIVTDAGVNGWVHLFADDAIDDALVKTARDRKVFVVPTATILCNVAGKNTCELILKNDSMRGLMNGMDRNAVKSQFPNGPGEKGTLRNVRHNIAALHRAGIPILAGTDSPNPGTVHGASMHQELQILVAAGLSPTEALRSATSIPADTFSLTGRGRIAVGSRADLLLVEGDPTHDIKCTMNIAAVWKNGFPIDLQKQRDSVAKENAAALAQTKNTGSSKTISNFDNGKISSEFGGGWMVSTDAIMGGSSTARTVHHAEGANGSRGSMTISGTVRKQIPGFAGAMFFCDKTPMQPANIGGDMTLRFQSRGDGGPQKVMLFFSKLGMQPSMQTFITSVDWQQHEYAISDFDGCDGSDVIGIWFGSDAPGDFEFHVDNVELIPSSKTR
ncbi:MAG: amidohydrolase family protein, partial [Planctomycetota bacterium]